MAFYSYGTKHLWPSSYIYMHSLHYRMSYFCVRWLKYLRPFCVCNEQKAALGAAVVWVTTGAQRSSLISTSAQHSRWDEWDCVFLVLGLWAPRCLDLHAKLGQAQDWIQWVTKFCGEYIHIIISLCVLFLVLFASYENYKWVLFLNRIEEKWN